MEMFNFLWLTLTKSKNYLRPWNFEKHRQLERFPSPFKKILSTPFAVILTDICLVYKAAHVRFWNIFKANLSMCARRRRPRGAALAQGLLTAFAPRNTVYVFWQQNHRALLEVNVTYLLIRALRVTKTLSFNVF